MLKIILIKSAVQFICGFFLIFFLTIQKLEARTTYKEIETYFEYEELEQYLSIAQRIEIEKLSRKMMDDEKIFVTIQSFFIVKKVMIKT